MRITYFNSEVLGFKFQYDNTLSDNKIEKNNDYLDLNSNMIIL